MDVDGVDTSIELVEVLDNPKKRPRSEPALSADELSDSVRKLTYLGLCLCIFGPFSF